MLRSKKKFTIGVVLLLLQIIAYAGSATNGNLNEIFSFSKNASQSEILGSIYGIIAFNLIGIIGLVLILISFSWAKEKKNKKSSEENCVDLLGQLMDETEKEHKKPQKSQEKERKRNVIYIILIFLVIMVILSFSFLLYQKNLELEYNKKEKDRFRKMYQSASNARDALLNESKELDFWERYAVIVTKEGEKYHTYGCQYIEGRDFWIYNVDAAIDMGYEPCSVCDPPDFGLRLKKID